MYINLFKNKNKDSNSGGYAIMFSVIMISVISTITIGILNSTYKQLILSSLAKDSQTAFYESDIATDCALYADIVQNKNSPFKNGDNWECGNLNLKVENVSELGYTLSAPDPSSSAPCFNISVSKTDNGDGTYQTEIKAKGYNICDKSNRRVVEREIQIDY